MGTIVFVSNGEKSTLLINGQCLDEGVTGIEIKSEFRDVSAKLDIGNIARLEPKGKEIFFERASEILGYKLSCET